MEYLQNLRRRRVERLMNYLEFIQDQKRVLKMFIESFEKGDRLTKLHVLQLLLEKLVSALRSWVMWFYEFDVKAITTEDELRRIFDLFIRFFEELIKLDEEYTRKIFEKYDKLNVSEVEKYLMNFYARSLIEYYQELRETQSQNYQHHYI